jgi:hypothetical protein
MHTSTASSLYFPILLIFRPRDLRPWNWKQKNLIEKPWIVFTLIVYLPRLYLTLTEKFSINFRVKTKLNRAYKCPGAWFVPILLYIKFIFLALKVVLQSRLVSLPVRA